MLSIASAALTALTFNRSGGSLLDRLRSLAFWAFLLGGSGVKSSFAFGGSGVQSSEFRVSGLSAGYTGWMVRCSRSRCTWTLSI